MDAAIVLEDAAVGHGGDVVLHGVDLALPAGATTALIGPNGSGKSTLLGTIAGLLPPLAGRVLVGGRPPSSRRGRTAMVLQRTADNGLLPVTVEEVVRMGRYGARGMFGRLRAEDHDAVEEAMARMDVSGLAGRQLRAISGGQRQRALVAQALAQRADVLLLDEPVTGLDLVSEQLISAAIAAERKAGRAVVLSTHDLREAGQADHVVLLAGHVVAVGPPQDVLTAEHLEAAYGRQLVHVGDEATIVDEDVHHDDHAHPHP